MVDGSSGATARKRRRRKNRNRGRGRSKDEEDSSEQRSVLTKGSMSEDDFSTKMPSEDGKSPSQDSQKTGDTKAMDVHQTDVFTNTLGSSSSSGDGQHDHHPETSPNKQGNAEDAGF